MKYVITKKTQKQKKSVRVVWTAIALTALLGAPTTSAQAPDLAPDKCYQVPLSHNLRWATAGVWWPGGDKETLLVSDSFRHNILRVSQQGRVGNRAITEKSLSFTMPSTIRTARGEALVEDDRQDEIHSLHSKLSFQIENRKLGRMTLKEFYDWVPLGEGYLAFGDLLVPNEEGGGQHGERAFLYVEEGGDYQVYERFQLEHPALNHYLRDTMAYLANFDDETGYILFFDRQPWIGEVKTWAKDIRPLDFFPEDFSDHPQLERNRELHGATQATKFYETYEASRMVVSLYAWEGSLYLLAKEEMRPNGTTPWWLIELSPRDGAELSRARLPSSAAHMTVVPGKDRWAFLEKGAVEAVVGAAGPGVEVPYMKTRSMVLMPTTWVSSLAESPLATKALRRCELAPQ